MSRTRKILLSIIALIIIIQFIRPTKNISTATMPNDIFAHYQASDTIKQLIKTACYNCHSNNTIYPWYSTIQPMAWWLNDHIKDGKGKINFSEFAAYTPKKADHKLKEVVDEVKEGKMPLKAYALIHKDSRINSAQRESIIQWVGEVRKQIQQTIQ